MTNIRIILLTVAVLLIGKTCSLPIESTTIIDSTTAVITPEPTTTLEPTTTPEPTTTSEPTTTPEPTTTTTTTLAPEVDKEWQDLVLAGPTVVNYLSLFMVLVSRGDQGLIPPAEYTVKYIQNVQSLRSILTQISSAMRSVFQTAQDDLVRIRSSMRQIPEHMKAGLVLIKSVPSEVLSTLLPYTLSNLDRAANEGSTVSKPTLNRFVSVGLLLDEVVTVLASTPPTTENGDYLIEANAYTKDMATQWNLLTDLFRKFSERADITQRSISNNYINPIDEAQKVDGFSSQIQREGELSKLVPVAIIIDQSSNLLDMMIRTYSDIEADHMASQITTSDNYLNIGVESERASNQRVIWQNTVSQSVDVARRAQTRHNEFAETGPDRQAAYATFLDTFMRV